MADNTAIEWADATLNFAWGCTKVSPGCRKCYVERNQHQSFDFHFLNFNNQIKKLQSWEKPRLIFVNSMSDTFHEKISDDLLDLWFETFKTYNKHTYIVLTKRINRAYSYFKSSWRRIVPINVWLGTSCENKWYLHRIEKLKKIKADTRFVSFEPLLGPIGKINLEGIHWAIVGGESDYKKPRFIDPAWAEEIRLQCEQKGISFFFKQMGGTNKAVDGSWGRRTLYGKSYQQYPKRHNEPLPDTTKQITLEESF
jgi:protein gp37